MEEKLKLGCVMPDEDSAVCDFRTVQKQQVADTVMIDNKFGVVLGTYK